MPQRPANVFPTQRSEEAHEVNSPQTTLHCGLAPLEPRPVGLGSTGWTLRIWLAGCRSREQARASVEAEAATARALALRDCS